MIKRESMGGASFGTKATATPIRKKKAELKLAIKGYAGYTIHRADGSTERHEPRPNVIPQAGYEWIADSLYDGTEPAGQARFLGLSKNNISSTGDNRATGDNFTVTDLAAPDGIKRRVTRNSPYVSDDKTMTLDALFTNGDADSSQITGIRTLTVYTALTGGTLIHAVSVDSFNLNGGDSVEVDWTITLSEPTS